MKNILLAVMLLFSLSLQGQTETKPPKLRYSSGFFTTKWELGDKDVSAKEVRSHLEKHSSEAYHYWRKAEGAATTSLIFNIVMIGGFITGIVSEDDQTQLIGYSVAAGAGLVSLVAVISSGSNAKKATNTYNRKFGY
jgi:hypothetical protein